MSFLHRAAVLNGKAWVKQVILKYPGPTPLLALMSGAMQIYTKAQDQGVSFCSSLSPYNQTLGFGFLL